MSFVIRCAGESDLDDLAALDARCQPSPWPRSLFERELKIAWATLRVAHTATDLLGYIHFWDTEDTLEIQNLAVAPSSRRKGIGSRLVGEVRNLANTLQKNILLDVRESNENAILLYKNAGFTALSKRQGYYRNNGENALVLQYLPRPL